jgi:hypothetical protein
LERRLRTFDRERLRRRAERGERAARVVPAGLYHPGRKAAQRTHWVFPVACESPTRLIDLLRRAGCDKSDQLDRPAGRCRRSAGATAA